MAEVTIRRIEWEALTPEGRQAVVGADRTADTAAARREKKMLKRIARIIKRVRTEGDAALLDYARRFDGVDKVPKTRDPQAPFLVSKREIAASAASLSPAVRTALQVAIKNARSVHRPHLLACQRGPVGDAVNATAGVTVEHHYTPVSSAGLYVPRGKGSFPSMMVMLGVPATLAAVPRITVVTPPAPDGTVDPATLYAADKLGIDTIHAVGGAQAIAALAYGTASIPRADKLYGPGSTYVTLAKQLLAGVVDVGLPAGPSESMIIADASADPRLTALDLMIEAEHGSDSSAYLVTPSAALAAAVTAELQGRIPGIPQPRRTYVTDVLGGNRGGVIICRDIQEAVGIANLLAPEHLKIDTAAPARVARQVQHSGEILIGPHAAFSVANYCTGANAILPTNRAPRTHSGLSVEDFLIRRAHISIDKRGIDNLGKHVEALADYEGFHCHAQAIRDRFPR